MKLVVDAKKLKAVSKAASTDGTRYTLCGVQVEIDEPNKTTLLVATDGRRMALMRDALDVSDFDGSIKSFIIPNSLLAKTPKSIAGKIYIVVGEGGRIVLEGDGQSVSEKQITGNYPNWRKTLPANPPADIKNLSVNLNFLNSFHAIGKTLGATGGQIFQHGENTVFTIKLNGSPECDDFYGLLMPMRELKEAAVPSWLENQCVNANG